MKKFSLVLIMFFIVGICIPTVSASEPIVLTDSKIETDTYEYSHTDSNIFKGTEPCLEFYRIENFTILKTVYCKALFDKDAPLQYFMEHSTVSEPVTFTYNDKYVGSGQISYNVLYKGPNIIGIQFWIDINDWDVIGLSGAKEITINHIPDTKIFTTNLKLKAGPYTAATSSYPCLIGIKANYYSLSGIYLIHKDFYWENILTIDNNIVSIVRNGYYSSLTVTSDLGTLSDESVNDINLPFYGDGTWAVTNVMGGVFSGELGDSVAYDGSQVTVYVKNSQTGALIANANIVIDALVNGTYYPVVNRTEPSGIFSINLQPTGGGQPNPDGYRLIVTADGYNNPMPEINFTVDDYKKYIYCLLDPIAGGPVNENKTFIDFFVRDMSSNPISGATVKFGKYTLITNSAGYTVFEVDKNNTYSWTVSKSGYGPLTGNAVIGNDQRHTINTVLAPVATPTTQTPIPTGTAIGPTPTMTAPTGEHVSNWLEWFAAHFGMILGGGVEIGKIFMWLCFTIPVGVYVGKESKSGAAGFMAGAGIVTLFFVLIGWVPIWLLVLLALIIGLLYAKVFNNSDTGGGR